MCGGPGLQYELYLAVEDVDHSRTKNKSLQTNGIAERFHKTVLDEFYRVVSSARKDLWIDRRTPRPTSMPGSKLHRWDRSASRAKMVLRQRPPMQTFLDATPLAKRGTDRRLITTDRRGPYYISGR